ncbi:MAG: hypothetical protein GF401_05035 [Chitinivibrionales bacterium]|nr:hypothetical protein [Chitinivibrionales bacterium]
MSEIGDIHRFAHPRQRTRCTYENLYNPALALTLTMEADFYLVFHLGFISAGKKEWAGTGNESSGSENIAALIGMPFTVF